MRAKKRYPGGLRLIGAALVEILMILGTVAIFASSCANTNANDSERRSVERAELAPLVFEGVFPEWERPQLEPPAPVQGGRCELNAEERDCIERVVTAEAGGEDYDGQCLVAQCILNTMKARGMSALEVVQEPKQYTAPAAVATESVKAAVDAVFNQGYRVTSEPVRYFYAPYYGYSAWHENSLVFVLEHGGHRFFKEG